MKKQTWWVGGFLLLWRAFYSIEVLFLLFFCLFTLLNSKRIVLKMNTDDIAILLE